MQEMQETQVQSLSWEDPMEKKMATCSSILAWDIPWTEKPGVLQSIGLQELDITEWLSACTRAHTHTHTPCWGEGQGEDVRFYFSSPSFQHYLKNFVNYGILYFYNFFQISFEKYLEDFRFWDFFFLLMWFLSIWGVSPSLATFVKIQSTNYSWPHWAFTSEKVHRKACSA